MRSTAGEPESVSPDKQQNGRVQAPLEGAEPDALDPDQLVGFILTQESTARHPAVCVCVCGAGGVGG